MLDGRMTLWANSVHTCVHAHSHTHHMQLSLTADSTRLTSWETGSRMSVLCGSCTDSGCWMPTRKGEHYYIICCNTMQLLVATALYKYVNVSKFLISWTLACNPDPPTTLDKHKACHLCSPTHNTYLSPGHSSYLLQTVSYVGCLYY